VRRIMVLVTVVLVMAAMMAVFSTGAMAEPPSNASTCSQAAVNPKEFEPNLGQATSAFMCGCPSRDRSAGRRVW
jgi:flagellar basal body-associated protein FliL